MGWHSDYSSTHKTPVKWSTNRSKHEFTSINIERGWWYFTVQIWLLLFLCTLFRRIWSKGKIRNGQIFEVLEFTEHTAAIKKNLLIYRKSLNYLQTKNVPQKRERERARFSPLSVSSVGFHFAQFSNGKLMCYIWNEMMHPTKCTHKKARPTHKHTLYCSVFIYLFPMNAVVNIIAVRFHSSADSFTSRI